MSVYRLKVKPHLCVFSRFRIYGIFRKAKTCVLDLLFPRSCAGCGRWDQYVCASCEQNMGVRWENVARMEPFLLDVSPRDGCAAPMFACYTLTHYAGVVRRIIIEWKHSHSYGLDQRILQIWRRCVECLFRSSQEGAGECVGAMSEHLIRHSGNLCFMPAPSGWRRRHEGRLVAAMLAQEAARVCEAPMCDVLRVRSSIGHSVKDMWGALRGWKRKVALWGETGYSVANFSERSSKRHRIYAKKRLDGLRVILVDDVVTTGATAGGAARAVKNAGGKVVAVIALASVARDNEKII